MMLKASDITRINTLSSMYDNGHIVEVSSYNKTYRISVHELLKIIKKSEASFEVIKSKKHSYLSLIKGA